MGVRCAGSVYSALSSAVDFPVINCSAAGAPEGRHKRAVGFVRRKSTRTSGFFLPAAGLLVLDRRGLPSRNDDMQQLAGGENRHPATLSQL
ncbi:unnamed protein product [Macrosiphum euphorbiae]|uniref:Uncharacterized protein n=1 Tax=Macrosiphum euphorbiae TaxID=13131 RepID=A0AAV0VW36_9HEMI|nr:unnamed protein product [Macrosiphum euphorbiae]